MHLQLKLKLSVPVKVESSITWRSMPELGESGKTAKHVINKPGTKDSAKTVTLVQNNFLSNLLSSVQQHSDYCQMNCKKKDTEKKHFPACHNLLFSSY